MAISIEDIKKLRAMTGAGLADVKKALTEAEGDFDKAKEILRERGLAIAAKRSDRETSNGCVLVKKADNFAAMIALKCETDFVANGADFIALTQSILDAAVANKCKTLDEVKELVLANGQKAQDAVTQRSGITGEKMELDGYCFVEGTVTSVYNHQNKNGLCTIAAFNKEVDAQLAKNIAMQIAAMNPIAVDEDGVSEEIKQTEINVAIEKTKAELVQKAVDAALNKAGINPAHVDSEDHMESNKAKGWITEEDVVKAKEIIATVSAEKAASLPEAMIQNIAKGRLAKFLKEVCLLNQEDILDGKKTVRETLKAADAELQIIAFKRFTLRAE
jgi:elongation factor Ts